MSLTGACPLLKNLDIKSVRDNVDDDIPTHIYRSVKSIFCQGPVSNGEDGETCLNSVAANPFLVLGQGVV